MKHTHSGWSNAEDELLLDSVHQAQESHHALQQAFDSVANQTNRRPNSVRNRYYAVLRNAIHPAPQFETFSDAETEQLLRDVLLAKAKGESVRACTLRLANGDTRRMLRYQNKYRAILKNSPERIQTVRQALAGEGYATPDPCGKRGAVGARQAKTGSVRAVAIRRLLDALYDDLVALGREEVS